MNEDSYVNDFDLTMLRLLSEHHLTMWSQEAFVETSTEFTNCMVGIMKVKVIILLYYMFFNLLD